MQKEKLIEKKQKKTFTHIRQIKDCCGQDGTGTPVRKCKCTGVGEKGDPGIRGAFGIPGEHGAIGPKGDQGKSGQKGDDGEKGQLGLIGLKGNIGRQGPPGPAGRDVCIENNSNLKVKSRLKKFISHYKKRVREVLKEKLAKKDCQAVMA